MSLGKIVLLGGIAIALLRGQDLPRFEITSVKPNKLDPRSAQLDFGCSESGRFVSRGMGIRQSLLWAYDLQPYQFAGFPEWLDSKDARFDIEAKAEGPLTQSVC